MSKIRFKMAMTTIRLNKIKLNIKNCEFINYLNSINIDFTNDYKFKKRICNDEDYHYLESSRFVHEDITKIVKKECINVLEYSNEYNTIVLYTPNKDETEIFENIVKIINLFDNITNKKNTFQLYLYLSNHKKVIDNKSSSIGPKSINSGFTLPGYYIVLFRREELLKVLIHEIIHYLKLDIFQFQDKIKYIYDDINLSDKLTNPNEAYTEFLAIILYIYFIYKQLKPNYSFIKYLNYRLVIELGWSFYQISKILNFFKCYNSYEDLFTKKCQFNQKTNVLSYFILKTYYLFNIEKFIKCINFTNSKNRFNCFKEINLKDNRFNNIINSIINKNINYDKSMRMTCLG